MDLLGKGKLIEEIGIHELKEKYADFLEIAVSDVSYNGIEVEPIREIAMWMPHNFFNETEVNLNVCNPIWNQFIGLAICFISGFSGMVAFSVWGISAL